MSDNTTQTQAQERIVLCQATRNGVTLDVVVQAPRRQVKGQPALPFAAPEFDKLALTDLITVLGEKEVKKKLVSSALARCKGFYAEACVGPDDAPEWDAEKSPEEYQKYYSDWSARGESMKELKERLAEYAFEMVDLFTAEGPMSDATMARIAELKAEVNELKQAIASKKRERSDANSETAEV